MSAWFESGRAVDLVLFVLAWLGGARRATLLGALVPGLFLLLALRAALTGAPWQAVALFLALALPAHLLDLGRRLR